MTTQIRHPQYNRREREILVERHSFELGANNCDESVHYGAFVVAWDGRYKGGDSCIMVGTLTEVNVSEKGTTFRISTGDDYPILYDNVSCINWEYCPDVVYRLDGKFGSGKLVGIREQHGEGTVVDHSEILFIPLCDIAYCDRDVHYGLKIDEVKKEEFDG